MFSGVCAPAMVGSPASAALTRSIAVSFFISNSSLTGSSDVCLAGDAAVDGVGLGQLGIELEAETRSGRHRDHAVLHFRQRGDEVAIPGVVEGAHALLDERV